MLIARVHTFAAGVISCLLTSCLADVAAKVKLHWEDYGVFKMLFELHNVFGFLWFNLYFVVSVCIFPAFSFCLFCGAQGVLEGFCP